MSRKDALAVAMEKGTKKDEDVKMSDLISQTKAAHLRGVTHAAISDLIRRGRLQIIEVAGRRLLRRDEVEAYEPSPGGWPKGRSRQGPWQHRKTCYRSKAGQQGPFCQQEGRQQAMNIDGEFESGNGTSPDEQAADADDADIDNQGVEIFTLADELGHGVYVSCQADVSPIDLLEGICNLLSQVTRAALNHPQVKRAGDLNLGEDVF